MAYWAVLLAAVVLLALVNTALFLPGKADLTDPAVIVGSLVGGLLTQGVLVAIVYGLYRLVRRDPPRQSLAMIAFRSLLLLAVVRVFTILVPPARLLKVPHAAAEQAPGSSWLYLWAGDSAGVASDFLAVIDATPGTPAYGRVVTSLPVGASGTHPHHTEAAMPASGHLLANGFHAGRTWLFDLSQPTRPRILASFGDVAGMSHPHTYWRLADGTVLTTFQYGAGDPAAGSHEHDHARPGHSTGGLVLMNERGRVIRSASARDAVVGTDAIFPYSALPLPAIDRVVSTTTNMDDADTVSTGRWIQLWRLSDLRLLRTFALEPGPRGNEHRWTGEPRLLADGRSVYIHTFMCGLYLLRGVDADAPRARLVHTFEGKNCGVPILAGHYWLATVPEAHALVALDIADPEHPREVSRVTFGPDESPHWAAMDTPGRRVVVNSANNRDGNRLFIVDFDPATGSLAVDSSFRDPGDPSPGINLSGRTWPHGFRGRPVPHGTVFSR